jgi:hypothetical protein
MDRLISPVEFARYAGIRVRDALALFRKDLVIGQQLTPQGLWRAPLYAVAQYLRGERPAEGDTPLMRERRRQYMERQHG